MPCCIDTGRGILCKGTCERAQALRFKEETHHFKEETRLFSVLCFVGAGLAFFAGVWIAVQLGVRDLLGSTPVVLLAMALEVTGLVLLLVGIRYLLYGRARKTMSADSSMSLSDSELGLELEDEFKKLEKKSVERDEKDQ